MEKDLIKSSKAYEQAGYRLTDEGCSILNQLAQARRKNLSEFIDDWSPEQRAEIADALQRLARELVPDVKPRRRTETA